MQQEDIDLWSETRNILDLDCQGLALAKSFLVLDGEEYSDENEVRLIYNYQPDSCNHVTEEVSVYSEGGVTLCKIPFDWRNIIREFRLPPDCTSEEIDKASIELEKIGLIPSYPFKNNELGLFWRMYHECLPTLRYVATDFLFRLASKSTIVLCSMLVITHRGRIR